uniref:Uncharacterized protein n=1 Tax=viral metagenome TaxID=1070528 RepID=A0A6C0KSP2_9ZZZZ
MGIFYRPPPRGNSRVTLSSLYRIRVLFFGEMAATYTSLRGSIPLRKNGNNGNFCRTPPRGDSWVIQSFCKPQLSSVGRAWDCSMFSKSYPDVAGSIPAAEKWFHSVAASTSDFESENPSSNLGGTLGKVQ